MNPLNVAVIGCGTLAQAQHLPNLVANPRTRLALCCDVAPAILAVCRDRFGAARTAIDWREATADPAIDLIVLATTEKLRLPVIAAAAAAGKPIYVEKPIATTLAELREIEQVVTASGIPFCVGHNRRAAPAMRVAQRIFRAHMTDPQPCAWRFDREGAARPRLADDGVPAMAVRINDDWHSWKSWVFDKTQAPHGPLLFELTHYTDICNWFMASEPIEVMAIEASLLNHAVIIRYANHALATICLGANGTFGYPKELYEVMGNGGIVVIDHLIEVRTAGISGAPARQTFDLIGLDKRSVPAPDGMADWLADKRAACERAAAAGNAALQFNLEPDKGHAHALNLFIDQILGQGPVLCGVTDAVRATRIAFAAIRSAQERRIVSLAEM